MMQDDLSLGSWDDFDDHFDDEWPAAEADGDCSTPSSDGDAVIPSPSRGFFSSDDDEESRWSAGAAFEPAPLLSFEEILTDLFTRTDLELLDLSSYALRDADVRRLAQYLTERNDPRAITTLFLVEPNGHEGSRDESWAHFFQSLAASPPLHTLDLRNLPLMNRDLTQALGAALATNQHLTHLSLIGCHLTAAAVTPLMDGIRLHPTLHHLSLCDNRLGAEGLDQVYDQLRGHPSLTSLNLRGNSYRTRAPWDRMITLIQTNPGLASLHAALPSVASTEFPLLLAQLTMMLQNNWSLTTLELEIAVGPLDLPGATHSIDAITARNSTNHAKRGASLFNLLLAAPVLQDFAADLDCFIASSLLGNLYLQASSPTSPTSSPARTPAGRLRLSKNKRR
jgi:hypothetical protein